MIYNIIENKYNLGGKVSEKKLILDPTVDMDLIEEWEARLDYLGYKYMLVECLDLNSANKYFSICCPDYIIEYGIKTYKRISCSDNEEYGMIKEVEEFMIGDE